MRMSSKNLIKIILSNVLLISSINAKADSNPISLDITSGNYQFQPCTVDVPNQPTLDISDYFESVTDYNGVYRKGYSDPFEFYTDNVNAPGVTLPGPSRQAHCSWKVGTNFTWNSQSEQCILNGTFGNSDTKPTKCTMNDNAMITDNSQIAKWTNSNGQTIMITGIPGEAGPVPVTIGFGHGVLNSTCGGVALVKNTDSSGTHYAAIMQVDARAWSFEISQPASTNLASDNYGGTCYIPEVTLLKPEDVQNILSQLPNP